MPRMLLGSGLKVTPTDWLTVSRGTYIFAGNAMSGGGWNGATAQLQQLSGDNVTAMNVAGAVLTADGSWTVDIGDDAQVRVAISVAVPSGNGLYFTLSRVA